MEEVIFMVQESPEGGYSARGLGISSHSQGETIEEIKAALIDSVRCHFDDGKKRIIFTFRKTI